MVVIIFFDHSLSSETASMATAAKNSFSILLIQFHSLEEHIVCQRSVVPMYAICK